MNKLDVLIKCIILLYREQEINVSQFDGSADLVKTVIAGMKDARGKALTGGETTMIDELRGFVLNMINHPGTFDNHTIIQSLEYILKDRQTIIKNLEKNLSVDLSDNQIKRNIVTLRNALNTYYVDNEMTNLVNKASLQLTTGKLLDSNENIKDLVSKLITNLEALNTTGDIKDPGIVDELDISDHDNMAKVLTKAKNNSTGTGKLITGWQELNTMTQGGFRRGETAVIYALQHKYKSGFTQSLFMQMPMHNVPIMDNPDKKPLIVYISAEDDTDVFTGFMYKYLYYNEHKVMPKMEEITGAEISEYISKKLTRNGYHVKIMKINPSDWTIKHLFTKINKLESEGFEIHGILFDYLVKMPTIGCTITGPGGSDTRDMFNRVRNVCSSKRILFITPHQLSTEAKQLIRNGVSDVNFVKEINGKGYSELSKQIDQVVDLELYIHIAHVNRKPFLTVQRGKHRIDNILDEDKHYFMLPFPYKAPILENLHGTVGETPENKSDSIDFDF